MDNAIAHAQNWVLLAIGLAALAMEIFALIDCLRRPAEAFPYADKRTKGFWLAVTGICAAVGFVSFWNTLGLVGLLAIVGAAVYLADVRPAVRMYRPRSRGTNSGPYGSW